MQRTTAVNGFLKHKPRFTTYCFLLERKVVQIEEELLIH